MCRCRRRHSLSRRCLLSSGPSPVSVTPRRCRSTPVEMSPGCERASSSTNRLPATTCSDAQNASTCGPNMCPAAFLVLKLMMLKMELVMTRLTSPEMVVVVVVMVVITTSEASLMVMLAPSNAPTCLLISRSLWVFSLSLSPFNAVSSKVKFHFRSLLIRHLFLVGSFKSARSVEEAISSYDQTFVFFLFLSLSLSLLKFQDWCSPVQTDISLLDFHIPGKTIFGSRNLYVFLLLYFQLHRYHNVTTIQYALSWLPFPFFITFCFSSFQSADCFHYRLLSFHL